MSLSLPKEWGKESEQQLPIANDKEMNIILIFVNHKPLSLLGVSDKVLRKYKYWEDTVEQLYKHAIEEEVRCQVPFYTAIDTSDYNAVRLLMESAHLGAITGPERFDIDLLRMIGRYAVNFGMCEAIKRQCPDWIKKVNSVWRYTDEQCAVCQLETMLLFNLGDQFQAATRTLITNCSFLDFNLTGTLIDYTLFEGIYKSREHLLNEIIGLVQSLVLGRLAYALQCCLTCDGIMRDWMIDLKKQLGKGELAKPTWALENFRDMKARRATFHDQNPDASKKQQDPPWCVEVLEELTVQTRAKFEKVLKYTLTPWRELGEGTDLSWEANGEPRLGVEWPYVTAEDPSSPIPAQARCILVHLWLFVQFSTAEINI